MGRGGYGIFQRLRVESIGRVVMLEGSDSNVGDMYITLHAN
jgi:hypothetical protein